MSRGTINIFLFLTLLWFVLLISLFLVWNVDGRFETIEGLWSFVKLSLILGVPIWGNLLFYCVLVIASYWRKDEHN
jgi:hypothetical protein